MPRGTQKSILNRGTLGQCILLITTLGVSTFIASSANAAEIQTEPPSVSLTGQKFDLKKYCNVAGSTGSGQKACGTAALEAGSLKKFLIDMLVRDIATINIQYYHGHELGPDAPRASNVPVCDLGRGLNFTPTRGQAGGSVDDWKKHPPLYKGGEGNFLPNDTSKNALHPAINFLTQGYPQSYQEARALKDCFLGNHTQFDACVGRNWMAEVMNAPSTGSGPAVTSNGSNRAVAPWDKVRQGYCGSPCIFVKSNWKKGNSDGQEEATEAIRAQAGSCVLEFAWMRGLWPRIVWSAATATESAPLKIGKVAGTNYFKGVFHEIINDGAINITRQGDSPTAETCGNLKQDIENYALRVRETRSQLDSITRRMGGSNGGLVTECRSQSTTSGAVDQTASALSGSQLSGSNRGQAEVRTAQIETSDTLTGGQNPAVRAAVQRASSAYCTHDAAQLQLYSSIGKLALCEVLARAKGKWDNMVKGNANEVIRSLSIAVDENHCHGCDDEDDQAARSAAYAVNARNWFIHTYLLDGTTPRLPVDTGGGKWSLEPPVQLSTSGGAR